MTLFRSSSGIGQQALEHTVMVKSSPPKNFLSPSFKTPFGILSVISPHFPIRMECISRLRNLLSNVFKQVAKLLGVIVSLRLTDITKLNMLRFRYSVTITSPTRGLNFDNSLWLIASRSNKTKLLSESRLRSSVMKCTQLSFKYVRFFSCRD